MKSFVVYVTPQSQFEMPKEVISEKLEKHYCINFITYDIVTGREVPQFTYKMNNLFEFIDNLPKFVITSVKGIVFNADGFKKNDVFDYNYCEHLVAKLNLHQIPFRFVSDLNVAAMCLLIATKVNPMIDKNISQIYVFPTMIKIVELIRTSDGYMMVKSLTVDEHSIAAVNLNKPNKTIIVNATYINMSEQKAKIEQIFSSHKPIILQTRIFNYVFDALNEIVDSIFDQNINKYYVIPQCFSSLGITNKKLNPSMADILTSSNINETLPVTKSCIVPRSFESFYIAVKNKSNYQTLSASYKAMKQCHRISLILCIDNNNIPTIKQKAVIMSNIENLPKKLNIKKTEKLPIIGFFDNASVICLWNEKENCYKFLDSWNGIFGKDLFLNFLLPKPTLVSPSFKVMSLPGVVYDLIKIISMAPNDIKIDSNWKFTFTKNEENPVLLEFDTFDGTKKAASPAFLMALFLKQHIKAIRKVVGEKPVKVGFRLLDDFENLEARKRVEEGLKEACEMLKIKCFFV